MDSSDLEYSEEGLPDNQSGEVDSDIAVSIEAPERKIEPPQNFKDFEDAYKERFNNIVNQLHGLEADENIPEMSKLRSDFSTAKVLREIGEHDRIKPAGYNASDDIVKELKNRQAQQDKWLKDLEGKSSDPAAVRRLAAEINQLNNDTLEYAKQRQAYMRQQNEDGDMQKRIAGRCKKVNGQSLSEGDPAKRWRQIVEMLNKSADKSVVLQFDDKGENTTTISQDKNGKLSITSKPANPQRDIETAMALGLKSITISPNSTPRYKQMVMELAKQKGITVRNPPELGQETLSQKLVAVGQQAQWKEMKEHPVASLIGMASLNHARYNEQKEANEAIGKTPNELFRKDIPKEQADAVRFIDTIQNGISDEAAKMVMGLDTNQSAAEIRDNAVKMLNKMEEVVPEEGGKKMIHTAEGRKDIQDYMKENIFKDQPDMFNKVLEKFHKEGGTVRTEPVNLESSEPSMSLSLGSSSEDST